MIDIKETPRVYSDEETKRRFEAALRGARAAAAQPMKDIPPKRKKGVTAKVRNKKKASAVKPRPRE